MKYENGVIVRVQSYYIRVITFKSNYKVAVHLHKYGRVGSWDVGWEQGEK